jgi:hypothetical protein
MPNPFSFAFRRRKIFAMQPNEAPGALAKIMFRLTVWRPPCLKGQAYEPLHTFVRIMRMSRTFAAFGAARQPPGRGAYRSSVGA